MDYKFSDHALSLLNNYYMKEGEEPTSAFRRAAYAYTPNKELAERVTEYANKGWFMFSSPILSNAGRTGLPISCFLTYVDDTVESLIDHTNEVRWMSVMGGGVGGHWSSVRSVSKKAPGPIPFLKTIDADMLAYSQGSTRRGSYAAYMDISHPDILEFLNIRVPTGGDANRKCFNIHNAVNITDAFMNAVYGDLEWQLIDPHSKEIKDSVKARELWQRLLETRFRTGEPYMHFIDASNRALPSSLKEKGLEVHGSNLCLSGTERVVTDRGLLTAKQLYDQGGELVVFDGSTPRKASAMQLINASAPTFKITLKNGLTHTVTAEHRVKTDKGDVECKDLKIGDRVYTQKKKGLFGTTKKPQEAFLLGLYQADGTQWEDTIFLDLWEPDFDLISEVEQSFSDIHYRYKCDKYEIKNQEGQVVGIRNNNPPVFKEQDTGVSKVRKMRLGSRTLKKALDFKKAEVPEWIWTGDEPTQWQYIRGLFYADGTCSVSNNNPGSPIYLSITNTSKSFLKDLQLLMRNLGLSVSLYKANDEGLRPLPDGKGGYKEYPCKATWRLIIGNKNDALKFEEATNFLSRKGITFENRAYRDNSRKVSEVVSIEPMGEEPVYCLKVDSAEHHFVANGVITHNCSEILLPTSKDRSAVCCLSSLNLEYYDDWKDTSIVQDLIEFLDDVLQYFIDNAPPSLARAINSAKKERSLGLGAMGFHSYLQRNNIPFEHMFATIKNRQIFTHIQSEAVIATKRLGELKGAYLDDNGTGHRNSHLLAIAPNANSSIILETSPSIEPWKSNAFTYRTRAGSFLQFNKYLETLLKTKNDDPAWLQETTQSIILNQGSVQHLDCLTDWEKQVFKTAFELDQMWIIEHASVRQEFICQGQSVNLFFPAGTDINYVNLVHLAAHKKQLKTLYYLRTTAESSAEKISTKVEKRKLKDVEECLSCQG